MQRRPSRVQPKSARRFFRRGTPALLLALAACGGSRGSSQPQQPAGTSAAAAAPAAAPAPQVSGAQSCPATGLWAECNVLYRITRAGYTPRRDSSAVHDAPLGQPGFLVRLGRAELEIFIYPTTAAREADQAKLDKRQFVSADQQQSIQAERTLIANFNLLALLNSTNDDLRQRVSDALMAGPPQPSPQGASTAH